jgi:hypothetical protein
MVEILAYWGDFWATRLWSLVFGGSGYGRRCGDLRVREGSVGDEVDKESLKTGDEGCVVVNISDDFHSSEIVRRFTASATGRSESEGARGGDEVRYYVIGQTLKNTNHEITRRVNYFISMFWNYHTLLWPVISRIGFSATHHSANSEIRAQLLNRPSTATLKLEECSGQLWGSYPSCCSTGDISGLWQRSLSL